MPAPENDSNRDHPSLAARDLRGGDGWLRFESGERRGRARLLPSVASDGANGQVGSARRNDGHFVAKVWLPAPGVREATSLATFRCCPTRPCARRINIYLLVGMPPFIGDLEQKWHQ